MGVREHVLEVEDRGSRSPLGVREELNGVQHLEVVCGCVSIGGVWMGESSYSLRLAGGDAPGRWRRHRRSRWTS